MEAPPLGLVISCSGWFLLVLGLAHPVGIAGCDDDAGVVEQAVQEADRGGVLGQEPPQDRTASGLLPERAPFIGG